MSEGAFVISLDFELHWGAVEKWEIEDTKQKFLDTRQAIARMLELFEKYDIHVTWATVGYLFAKDRIELNDFIPAQQPQYHDKKLSTYSVINEGKLGCDELSDPSHFASSIIANIKSFPHQEIGSHTFSHYYTLEEGQTLDDFNVDLQSSIKIAEKNGLALRSIVFPRNQFNSSYLDCLSKEEFKAVRSNPNNWIWKNSSSKSTIVRKFATLLRGLDLIIPITNTLFSLDFSKYSSSMYLIPASRFLRPYSPRDGFLNNLKRRRIKSEMLKAAKQGKGYHLWWHPHNFSDHTEENLAYLEDLLVFYSELNKKYGFRSLNMEEAAAAAHKNTGVNV